MTPSQAQKITDKMINDFGIIHNRDEAIHLHDTIFYTLRCKSAASAHPSNRMVLVDWASEPVRRFCMQEAYNRRINRKRVISKGTPYCNIIRSKKYTTGGMKREKVLHATKGWRDYRVSQ